MDTGAASAVSEPPRRRSYRRLFAALQIAFGLGLTIWFVSHLELGALAELARRGRPLDLVLGLAFTFAAFPLLQAVRLHVLVSHYTGRFSTTMTINLIGALFNHLLPSNVAGDGIKLFYLQRLQAAGWGGPLAMLLLHRLSGVMLLHAAALVCVLARYDAIVRAVATARLGPIGTLGTVVGLALGAVLGVAAFVLLLPAVRRKGGSLLRRLWNESWAAVRDTPRRALGWLFVWTLAFQGARAAGFLYMLAFVGERANPLDVVIAMAVTAVAAMLPITVGGLGVMEGALGVTLVAFGVSAQAAISVALVQRVVLIANAAAGGFSYALYGRRRGD
jgi:uncharacterized membrane protein YbhN (UPF0104 family)